MQLNVTDEQLQSVITAAILQSLGTEQRDALMTEAIKGLMELKQDNGYGRSKRTQLQEAFQNAAYTVANKMAREFFEQDENAQAQMKQLVIDAWLAAMTTGREALVERIASNISKSLSE